MKHISPKNLSADQMRAYARALQEAADGLLKAANALDSITRGAGAEESLKKPDAWNVADDLEILLENGKKTWAEDDLLRYLVDNKLVKGSTRNIKFAAARRSLTRGMNSGYMRVHGGKVDWIPGVYTNERVRKT